MSILPQKTKELQLSYSSEKIDEVAEEIKQILTEGEFNARWTLLETYHKAGQLILQEFPHKTTDVLQTIAAKIGRSERTLWYAVAFTKKYPDMNVLPEGKNVSWSKVVNKYLTKEKSEDNPCEHEFIEVCRKCGIKKNE